MRRHATAFATLAATGLLAMALPAQAQGGRGYAYPGPAALVSAEEARAIIDGQPPQRSAQPPQGAWTAPPAFSHPVHVQPVPDARRLRADAGRTVGYPDAGRAQGRYGRDDRHDRHDRHDPYGRDGRYGQDRRDAPRAVYGPGWRPDAVQPVQPVQWVPPAPAGWSPHGVVVHPGYATHTGYPGHVAYHQAEPARPVDGGAVLAGIAAGLFVGWALNR